MSDAVKLRFYSSVESTEVKWLWYPHIPYGKLTILQGDPGEGKSTLVLNITALLTTGRPMPDGFQSGGPHNVLYQCSEDDASDTIKPRLLAAGADCDRVAFIQDDEMPLTLCDDRIEKAILKTRAKLLVLDPIQAYLPQEADMQSAQRMRGVLQKLNAIASRTNCAIVLVGHVNKDTAGKNLYRGLGSIDIAAIARSILMIERDTYDPAVRYMFPVKTSLAPEGPAIAFTFDHSIGFRWQGPREHSCGTGYPEETSKRGQAAQILLCILEEGEMESREIFHLFETEGISRRTVQTAKKDLNLEAIRKNGVWYWRIPSSITHDSEMEDDDV